LPINTISQKVSHQISAIKCSRPIMFFRTWVFSVILSLEAIAYIIHRRWITEHKQKYTHSQCQWWHGSAAARLLELRVRISLRAWNSMSYDCCLLSGRDFCFGLITRLEESCGMWCVSVW
jgi:hypothetical protein